MFRKAKKHKDTVTEKLQKSPINYFSDLFIVAMVVFWIVDNVYQSIIATAVTASSIYISLTTGVVNFDTSMWASIGNNVAIPLSCGGAIWMVKNSVQHAIAYTKGKKANQDFPFPKVDGADNYNLQPEEFVDWNSDQTTDTNQTEMEGQG